MLASPYSIRFSADPVQLTFFRYGLGRWLHGLQWPEAERDDVILAVSEACANSVEHAYIVNDLGDVEVSARLVLGPDRRQVAVEVRDWGRWSQGPGDPGLGLVLMRECMDRVRVRKDEHGTLVVMSSRAVPLIDAESHPAALD